MQPLTVSNWISTERRNNPFCIGVQNFLRPDSAALVLRSNSDVVASGHPPVRCSGSFAVRLALAKNHRFAAFVVQISRDRFQNIDPRFQCRNRSRDFHTARGRVEALGFCSRRMSARFERARTKLKPVEGGALNLRTSA